MNLKSSTPTTFCLVVKSFYFLMMLSSLYSCKETEEPKCSFTFKNKRYESNDVFCIDDPGPSPGVGLIMKARGSWGILEIDQRVNYLRIETTESAPFYFDSSYGPSTIITRNKNSLEFNATLGLELNGSLTTGSISGTCTCTRFN